MKQTIEKLRKKLNACGIHGLRQLGRAVGVSQPTVKKKDALIDDIMAIATGMAQPVEFNHRGAPPKSEEFNKQLLSEIEECRRYHAGLAEDGHASVEMAAESAAKEESRQFVGLLDSRKGYWFVRSGEVDVFVGSSFVSELDLRPGDLVACTAVRTSGDAGWSASVVTAVNGGTPRRARARFADLTACYPVRPMLLGGEGSAVGAAIDLFAPAAFGRRALIVSHGGAGKTALVKDIALSVAKNHPEAVLILALIDERPEEINALRAALPGALMVCTSFDEDASAHIRAAKLAVEHAERMGEEGRDAVLVFDGFSRLTRAFAEADGDDELTDSEAVMAAKRLFGAARNTEEGASVTIFAVIDDYCSVEFYFSMRCELIDMCDMRIELPFSVLPGRRKPVIDIGSSYAMGEENLLSAEQLAVASRVRERVDECSLGSERVAAYAASADLNGFVDACRRLAGKPLDD